MITLLLTIFICSYLAFSLSAICGGGAGLILMPILGRLLPISQVPAALSIGTFTSSFTRVISFRKFIRWNIVKWFVPAAIPAVWFGAWLLKYINPIYLEVIMGLFLISNLPLVFKKAREIKLDKKPHNYILVLIGLCAGLLSGLTGAVGLLFNKFYLRYELTKEEIIATRAANEIILHLIKIILYTLFGLISIKVIEIGITVATAALLSTLTIKYILPLLSEFAFKKTGYSAMVFSGFIMLTQSGQNILLVNNGDLTANKTPNGLETKLKWQASNFILEFTYDEGFEFEQLVPLSELSELKQKIILSQKKHADKVIIESVYSISESSYEAYYFYKGQLINKIDIE